MHALRRHGEVRLRAIAIENIRPEVYAAAMSISVVVPDLQEKGRYQPFKIAIEPVTVAVHAKSIVGKIEPQPMLF